LERNYVMTHRYQPLGFFHQKLNWPIEKVKFGDYKISRKIVTLVKDLPQHDDLTQGIRSIHNYYLDLRKQIIEFKNKNVCYYYEHTNAIQKCLDAIYLLGNCQFLISGYCDKQDKIQLAKTNGDYLLEALCFYFEIIRLESKEKDFKIVQELQRANYSAQHKIGILSCNLQGLEKLAEVNLISALKLEQSEKRLVNIIQTLKYLYTKSHAQFSCKNEVKEEILSIIDNKYERLPESVGRYRNDFEKGVQSELRHNIACVML